MSQRVWAATNWWDPNQHFLINYYIRNICTNKTRSLSHLLLPIYSDFFSSIFFQSILFIIISFFTIDYVFFQFVKRLRTSNSWLSHPTILAKMALKNSSNSYNISLRLLVFRGMVAILEWSRIRCVHAKHSESTPSETQRACRMVLVVHGSKVDHPPSLQTLWYPPLMSPWPSVEELGITSTRWLK